MANAQVTPAPPFQQFIDAITEKGITPPRLILPDGQIHRFSSNGKPDDDAGWYVFYDGKIAAGAFGDFRTGIKVDAWKADIGRPLTTTEQSDFKQQQAEIRAKREADNAIRRAEARSKATGILFHSEPASENHPYLVRKGVSANGLRSWNNLLVVPLIDDTGEIQSVQLIDGEGEKKFLSGGKMQGSFHVLGALKNADIVLIAEGFATAATIHKITGHPVVIAFNAGNLMAVAKTIRAKNRDASIILCADDDWKTAGNPGLIKATEAAEAVGGRVLTPEFGKDRPDKATDFNDMAALAGKAAVTSFFTEHFLKGSNDMMQTAQNFDDEQIEALISRPGTTILPTGGRVFTGTLSDFGPAPYKNDPKNRPSYFIKLKNGDEERPVWGIGLGTALHDSGFKIGDRIAVYDTGKISVQVPDKVADPDTGEIHEQMITTKKGTWRIGSLDEYINSRKNMAREMAHEEPEAPADPGRPRASQQKAAPQPNRTYQTETIPEPKAHFSGDDFAAIQQIWKNVPRQAARHSEAGYDILLNNKSRVRITKDRIEMAKKARHRPDAAYIAACEHARQFWGSQIEIQGDTQHRIRAWAYAQAYGVKVTNFTPNDAELVEANKILKSINKTAEPGFRRPTGAGPQGGKRPTARLDI